MQTTKTTLTAVPSNPKIARFEGFTDSNDRFITFSMADEVFERAHNIGARVLLRLELTDEGELKGSMYTNDRGLSRRQKASS